jgi:glycosyltransferase involved in cell wall biosynthesis
LLEGLCAEIEFVPVKGPGFFNRLTQVGPYVKDRALAAAVRERLAVRSYGAIQLEKPGMIPYVPSDSRIPLVLDIWAYGLAASLRALRKGTAWASRARQMVRLVELGAFERWCWPEIHCLLLVSDEDRVRCERARPDQRTLVVPNGVDCRTILPKRDYEASPPVLLFTGDMAAEPNVEAALVLATEIYPVIRREYPSVEIRFVGRNPDPRIRKLAGNGIVVTGAVPDVQPHLQAASIYVAPHFTRASARTKLLEAMAAGLPIITTPLGIEGIKAQAGRDLLIEDTAADIVESIHTLLASQTDRERFGRAARHLAEIKYDWSRCLWPLEPLYRDLLEEKAAAS